MDARQQPVCLFDAIPHPPMLPQLEICIDCSTEDHALTNAMAASRGGAHRLECCARMDVGGLTPSPVVLERIRRQTPGDIAVLSMIRPREGPFFFSAPEVRLMQFAIRDAALAGADGVVIGALVRPGDHRSTLDRGALDLLCTEAENHSLSITFHRAFDAVMDRDEALEQLLSLPIQRILTAGTPWNSGLTAVEGVEVIADLGRSAAGRIEFVVGGGVGADNAGWLAERLASVRPLSLHAYSSVMDRGYTRSDAVAVLRKAFLPS